jgi:hypothetical protein
LIGAKREPAAVLTRLYLSREACDKLPEVFWQTRRGTLRETFLLYGGNMIHVVKLINRRCPNAGGRIVISLFALSASALAIGAGLLLLS